MMTTSSAYKNQQHVPMREEMTPEAEEAYNRSGCTNYYRRWEVCVSNKFNLNSYVGYCKAQFNDERRRYIVLKARGNGIENAIKVMQLVKETIGGVHSCIFMALHVGIDRKTRQIVGKTTPKEESEGKQTSLEEESEDLYKQQVCPQFAKALRLQSELGLSHERTINNLAQLESLSSFSYNDDSAQMKIIPAINIVLSKDEMHLGAEPGYQPSNPQVLPILCGPQSLQKKKMIQIAGQYKGLRNLNYDYAPSQTGRDFQTRI